LSSGMVVSYFNVWQPIVSHRPAPIKSVGVCACLGKPFLRTPKKSLIAQRKKPKNVNIYCPALDWAPAPDNNKLTFLVAFGPTAC